VRPLDGLPLVLSLADAAEGRAIARYLEDAGARVVLEATGPFVGVRLAGSNNEMRVALLDAPVGATGLVRPWRREALVRAVARAFGRSLPVLVAVVPAAPSAAQLGGRVLVVDDNSVNRRILARQVELAGASTDTAAGGEEALELMRRGHYDLVLADLQMPGMDGFDLARRIRAREREADLQRTPILAITASAFEDQEARSRDVGMDGLVTKPVGIEQLRATLDVWLKDAKERAA
jgi:CheY-like chemotaxis protein